MAHKHKAKDLSTPWSEEWTLDADNRYYKSRYNSAGVAEYWYDEPNSQPDNIPRNAAIAPYTSSHQYSTGVTQAEYTTSPPYGLNQPVGPYVQASGSTSNYSSPSSMTRDWNAGSSQGLTQSLNAGQITILLYSHSNED